MNIELADLAPVALDVMLAVGILILLVADLFVEGRASKRWLGYGAAALCGGVFAASFSLDTSGAAFWGAYSGGAWALFFKRVFLVIGALAILASVDHVAERAPYRQGEYYLLLLFSLLGMTLLAGARDLVLLIVCFELMGVPLFVLAAYEKTDRGPKSTAAEAGLKLYLVGVVSTAITLFGLSLVYGMTGHTSVTALLAARPSSLLVVGMTLVIAGMGFKIGAVPFHMWVPDTYQGSATPFVAFLSVAPKLAGFAALATIFMLGLSRHEESWLPVVLVLSLVSMVVGNVIAVVQTHVKRLLAYSGIAHIGYMLLGFATGDAAGSTMLLFYAVAYALTNVGAFAVVQVLAADGGDDSIKSFDGLARRSPYLALAMLVFLLSLAGIPFVVGFWAKVFVFLAAWEAGYQALVLTGAVLSVVALFYYLQIARAMYMNPPTKPAAPRAGFGLSVAIFVCLLGVAGLGLWPDAVMSPAIEATEDSPALVAQTGARR